MKTLLLLTLFAGAALAPAQQASGCYDMIQLYCSRQANDNCDNGCTNWDATFDACQAEQYAQGNCPFLPTEDAIKAGPATKK